MWTLHVRKHAGGDLITVKSNSIPGLGSLPAGDSAKAVALANTFLAKLEDNRPKIFEAKLTFEFALR